MAVAVNGVRIEDAEIQAEFGRMQQEMGGQGAPPPRDPQVLQKMRDQAQDRLIDRTLLSQKARKSEIEVPDAAVERELARTMDAHGGRDAFFQKFRMSESDEPRVRANIRASLRMQRFMEAQTKDLPDATDAEVAAEYTAHMDRYQEPEQVHMAHVVKRPSGPDDSETFRLMCDLRRQAVGGADFGSLAAANSECQSEPNGDLGFFAKGQMVEQFDVVAFSMEAGEISPVFMTPFGYHIAKLVERKPARQKSLEEARADIRGMLAAKRRDQVIRDLVAALRSEATIVEVEARSSAKPKSKGKKRK